MDKIYFLKIKECGHSNTQKTLYTIWLLERQNSLRWVNVLNTVPEQRKSSQISETDDDNSNPCIDQQ